jgi:glucose/arabinose dehydrogenase
MIHKRVFLILVCLGLLMAGLHPQTQVNAGDQPQIDWPKISLQFVDDGLERPVHITHAGDNSGNLFVVEQAGRIRILENGKLGSTFLNISDRVLSPSSGGGGEEGLLSVAFPPGYGPNKPYFYVYYTNRDSDNQISRFHLGANPNQADPGSEELILYLDHPGHSNHNGGQLLFGPDGYLYIGTGDGGGSGDPDENAQNPASLLGKLLRIAVEPEDNQPLPGNQLVFLPRVLYKSTGTPQPRAYNIPPDNPFINTPGFRGEIWALGLRNPWRFSFDRQLGDLYLGDVGQNAWEEIDFQPGDSSGGENYGWNILEGLACYLTSNCDDSGMTAPVQVYSHGSSNCSVTGGSVYRGSSEPGLQGIYFFADYCSGQIWGLVNENSVWSGKDLLNTDFNISTFGENQAGELYLVDHAGGGVYQLVEANQ